MEEALEIPYTFLTQVPIAPYELSFVFESSGEVISDWITVDQESQLI